MPQLRRTPVTWLIYVHLGLYCYFLYGFGPMVAVLREEQRISHTLASLHSTSMAVGVVAGGLVFPTLARRFGRSRLMWTAVQGLAATVLGFVLLPAAYAITLALTAAVAFCGVLIINGVVISLTQLHGPAGPAAISEANAMAVASGMTAPLLLGLSISAGFGWRGGVGLLAVAVAVVTLVAWRLHIQLPTRDSTPVTRVAKAPLGRAYWLTWTMMVITGAVEVVLSMWSATVLHERTAMPTAAAAAAVSAITAGMLIGRIGGARLTLRARPIPLYYAALAVSMLGFALFWLIPHPVAAVIGLLITGMGNGMHYPLAIALALAVAANQPDRAASVAAHGMAISFGAAPFTLGLLADAVGAHTALLLVPCFIVAAAALAARLQRATPRPSQAGALDDTTAREPA